jgi:xanthine dehydrogenase YagS FAD-binding subunit
MKNFEYLYPKNADTIPALLADSDGQALIFAGGTDAISRLKEGLIGPKQIINIKSAKDLNYIKETENGVEIGATTKLVDLIEHPAVQAITGLVEAAKSVGTIQLRNMGTVGGNLCQRPRCWYFRSRHFPCLRKHGETCYAIYGKNKYHGILGGDPCFIVHPSDLAPMLIALDAKVEILGPNGTRQIALEELFVLPEQDPYNETILTNQELVTKIIVPEKAKSQKSHYLKYKERKSMDFALVSVALSADVSGKTVSNVRIAMGGVAPVPWRAKKAEQTLENQSASEDLVRKAGEAEMQDAEPLTENEFKTILARNLLVKAFRDFLA